MSWTFSIIVPFHLSELARVIYDMYEGTRAMEYSTVHMGKIWERK
jgi:hypothetical protein